MNFYKHHIGDYRRDTAHLSLLEHGVYRQLMDTYYLSEEPIPNETELVMRRLSAKPRKPPSPQGGCRGSGLDTCKTMG